MIDRFSEQSITHRLSEVKCSADLVLWLFSSTPLVFLLSGVGYFIFECEVLKEHGVLEIVTIIPLRREELLMVNVAKPNKSC